jgi:hypothetical protein
MFLSRRGAVRAALSTAAAVGLLAAAPLPAEAAAGSIVCNGPYLCIQTVSSSSSGADVNAWANTESFYGYFYLNVWFGSIGELGESPQQTWPAGGKHYTFSVDCSTSAEYNIQAIDGYTGGTLGSVDFTIHSC